jgi:hypothetical protein
MEDFTPIKSYETYGVNKIGQVKCLRTGNILPQYDVAGYKRLNLRNPDGYKCFFVHRLVALTFIENPNNLDEVDHIDRNRSNNHIDNLRWADDYIQANNKCGWGKIKHLYITLEKGGKKSYTSYRFQIHKSHIPRHSKRFRTDKFTLQDAVNYRNEFLKNNNIEIPD